MKKRWMIFLCLLAVCGCTTGTTESKDKPGQQKETVVCNELAQLDMESLKDKLNRKESFVVMVTQSTCSYCNNMKRSVIPYIREHPDIPFYELEVDMLGTKKSDIGINFDKLKTLIKEFSGSTPELLYIKDGNVAKQATGDMNEAAFHNFLVDCGLVKTEKKKEERSDTSLKTSSYLKQIKIEEAAKMIEKKENFYLYIAESDRYNTLFSKTLAAYAEKNKTSVYVLNLTDIKQPETQEEMEKLSEAQNVVEAAIKGYQYTPSVLHIQSGIMHDILVDNVEEAELIKWFEKQQDGE